jgi:hypothetical protein
LNLPIVPKFCWWSYTLILVVFLRWVSKIEIQVI